MNANETEIMVSWQNEEIPRAYALGSQVDFDEVREFAKKELDEYLAVDKPSRSHLRHCDFVEVVEII